MLRTCRSGLTLIMDTAAAECRFETLRSALFYAGLRGMQAQGVNEQERILPSSPVRPSTHPPTAFNPDSP